MIKKITILAALLTLSGCRTYYEMKNCDSEKNYINSNPNALENYKKIVAAGEVNSYYLKIIPTKTCENNKCISYEVNKYDFIEMYFDDSSRKGIYTIKLSNEKLDKNCIKKQYSSDKKCYSVTKNNNNEIKSRFYVESNYSNHVFYKKFTDLKENIVLFESSYQVYHIPTPLDIPSGGVCNIKSSPENYIFDIYSYPK
jgi:hypothetical protein